MASTPAPVAVVTGGSGGIGFACARGPLRHRGDHLFDPVADFYRLPRLPLDFFERFLAPLPPAVHRQREAIALKRLDQHVGNRPRLRVAVEQFGVGRGNHDGGVGVVPLQLGGEPQAVVSGHHDVDHRQVALLFAKDCERLVGAGGGFRLEAKQRDPSSHEVAHRRFIVDDQYGGQWSHSYVPARVARLLPAMVAPIYMATVCGRPADVQYRTLAHAPTAKGAHLRGRAWASPGSDLDLAGFSTVRATRPRACFLDNSVQGAPPTCMNSLRRYRSGRMT